MNVFQVLLTVLQISILFCDEANLTRNTSCITPNGLNATCVSLYECPTLLKALCRNTSSSVEFVRRSHCGYDGEQLVCCGPHSHKTPARRNGTSPLLPSRKICGLQHTDDRFYAGTDTAIDEFPWMALLKMQIYGRDVGYLCAGSLISQRYVLTAAQCLTMGMNVSQVRLGEYNQSNPEIDCVENPAYPECADPVKDIKVEETIVHPNFDKFTFDNDIALIRLKKNVRYSEWIRPICLPNVDTVGTNLGDVLVTSGWGLDSLTTKSAPVKKRGRSNVTDEDTCKKLRNPNGYSYWAGKQLCAIDIGESSSCQGDSGAPVMFQLPQRIPQWQQEGIVSIGQGCGPGSISIHTKVSDYVDWIISKIKP